MDNFFILSIDPNSTSLLGFILAGVTTIISVLFASMVKAKNEQLKEKDETLKRVIESEASKLSILKEANQKEVESLRSLISDLRTDNAKLNADNINLMTTLKPHMSATTAALEKMLEFAQQYKVRNERQ